MKQIADKFNTMVGVKVVRFLDDKQPKGILYLDKFHWLQFTCEDKSSLDTILSAVTAANCIVKLEEGWGTNDVPSNVYVYTLLIEKYDIEIFKKHMGMPHIVSGGIRPIAAKDISVIREMLDGIVEEPIEKETLPSHWPSPIITILILFLLATGCVFGLFLF